MVNKKTKKKGRRSKGTKKHSIDDLSTETLPTIKEPIGVTSFSSSKEPIEPFPEPPDEFVCSITHELMVDPVVIADGRAIETWIQLPHPSRVTLLIFCLVRRLVFFHLTPCKHHAITESETPFAPRVPIKESETPFAPRVPTKESETPFAPRVPTKESKTPITPTALQGGGGGADSCDLGKGEESARSGETG